MIDDDLQAELDAADSDAFKWALRLCVVNVVLWFGLLAAMVLGRC